ncbi:MAG: bacterioferritin [Ilumatobacteraceae bacterium]
MQGNPEIVELLNEVLTAELTAINQYVLHAKIMEDWGYLRLAEHTKHESIDEMKHADEVTDRILFFDGTPNYQRYFPLRIGETVPRCSSRPRTRYTAVERLNRAIAKAVEVGDNGRVNCSSRSSSPKRNTSTGSDQLTDRPDRGRGYLAEQLKS